MGGGGGGGAFVTGDIEITYPQTLSITIGAGGLGSSAYSSFGTNGGFSSIGSFVTAPGGGAGGYFYSSGVAGGSNFLVFTHSLIPNHKKYAKLP